jgi:hypothetical protein
MEKHLIEEEIGSDGLLKEIQEYSGDLYVVESNHDVFLDQHQLETGRGTYTIHLLTCSMHIQQTVEWGTWNILGYLIDQEFKDEVKVLKMGDSFKIADYECALHGDFGTNGARECEGFGRLNVKLITAHTQPAMLTTLLV